MLWCQREKLPPGRPPEAPRAQLRGGRVDASALASVHESVQLELSQERWRESTNFSFPWLWSNYNSICFPSQSSIFYFLLKHKKLRWWGFSLGTKLLHQNE